MMIRIQQTPPLLAGLDRWHGLRALQVHLQGGESSPSTESLVAGFSRWCEAVVARLPSG